MKFTEHFQQEGGMWGGGGGAMGGRKAKLLESINILINIITWYTYPIIRHYKISR